MKARIPLCVGILFSLGGLWWPATLSGQEAVLKSGDKIRLQIKGVPDEEKPEVDGDYTISEAGTISLPYITNPQAAGVKPSILARMIETAYREAEIYTSPTIVINFGDERVVRRVTVTGGVNRQGPVDFFDGMTLLEAISTAGGLSKFAKQKEVKLIRENQTTSHDLDEIVRDNNRDVGLIPGDKIVVPEAGRKL